MQDFTFTFEIVLTFVIAFIGGVIVRKIRLPLLTGYVFAGVLGGIFFPQLKESQGVATLANVGVAFLLFALGVEFSLYKLRQVKKVVFYGGILQILATIFWGMFLFSFFGMSLYESIFLGSVFSLSSTAVVVKILSDRGEMDTLPGEIMIGILVMQDLAVLPMAIILPTIATLSPSTGIIFSLSQILLSLIKAGFLLSAILLLGKRGMPFLINKIASLNSRELLLLAVSGLCLTAALFTHLLGLSFALGAFLAGILIAETSSRHAVFSEIRPLRDVFSIIFFVSLGLFFNVNFFLSSFLLIIVFSVAILLVKSVVVFFITLNFGYHLKTAFYASLGIFQVGEFAFLLSRSELLSGHISQQTYSLVLATTLITLVATPFVFSVLPRLYIFLEHNFFVKLSFFKKFLYLKESFVIPEELSGHVIICGYGRVGRHIGRALELARIPFVVIDYNHSVVNSLREHGQKVVFGDPTEIDVLKAAGVSVCRAVVIAIGDRWSQEIITSLILTLNSRAAILCRSHYDEDRERLLASGVNFVIQPEFEAGLAMIGRILSIYDRDLEISSLTSQIRREHH